MHSRIWKGKKIKQKPKQNQAEAITSTYRTCDADWSLRFNRMAGGQFQGLSQNIPSSGGIRSGMAACKWYTIELSSGEEEFQWACLVCGHRWLGVPQLPSSPTPPNSTQMPISSPAPSWKHVSFLSPTTAKVQYNDFPSYGVFQPRSHMLES